MEIALFPYTTEEAEWLSADADGQCWLLGRGDLELAKLSAPANDDRPQPDRS